MNYFVNGGDARADLFRELRGDTADLVDEWTAAREAAARSVELAYEEYASSLERMGVDPKPVC